MKIIVVVLLVACSKPDDCERLVKKMGAVPELKRHKSDDELVAECRKAIDKVKDDPMIKCVLDADGDDAVRACTQAQLERMRAKEAELMAAQAVKDAQEARDKLDKIQADLDDLNKRVDQGVQDVTSASNKADIEAAKAKLVQLQKDQQDMMRRIAEAKAAAAKAERAKGVHISPECLKNPLAKGCN